MSKNTSGCSKWTWGNILVRFADVRRQAI